MEKAPWWGGYWERLVRSIKSPIKKVIGRSAVSHDEMCTLLTEVEAVINARPLRKGGGGGGRTRANSVSVDLKDQRRRSVWVGQADFFQNRTKKTKIH